MFFFNIFFFWWYSFWTKSWIPLLSCIYKVMNIWIANEGKLLVMLFFEFSSIKFHTKICHKHVMIKISRYFDNISLKYQISMEFNMIYKEKYEYLIISVNYQYFRRFFAICWDDQHNQTPIKRFFMHYANWWGTFAPYYISCSKYIYIYMLKFII